MAEELDLEVVELSRHAREFAAEYDEERGSTEVDVDEMGDWAAGLGDVVFDGHVSHHLDVDHVVVLRCHPDTLMERLRDRGYGESKVQENASSEALDLVVAEAIHRHEEVYEVDTTDRSPEDVAEDVVEAVRGGLVNASMDGITVDWSSWLESST